MASLLAYVRAARDLGVDWIAANDHFVFHRPWIDGPSALAMVLPETGGMTLATTITLPVLRHPVPLAKALGTLDLLPEGRVVVGWAGLASGGLPRARRAVGGAMAAVRRVDLGGTLVVGS